METGKLTKTVQFTDVLEHN